jgi:hypothetical protein
VQSLWLYVIMACKKEWEKFRRLEPPTVLCLSFPLGGHSISDIYYCRSAAVPRNVV